MSVKLDREIHDSGTRFRVFVLPPYASSAFAGPVPVRVRPTPQEIGSGPADDRMYVLDAVAKRPYGQRPYFGQARAPVPPGPDGHFDHLEVDSREFSCAMMYASVRRVLDIWEDYFQSRIEWSFGLAWERLELIPLIEWGNAQSGFGFLEFGFARSERTGIDRTRPYCHNFDVLAHELGHTLIFSKVGSPAPGTDTDEFWGFHESAGDLVALVAALHFDELVRYLLEQSSGNLFTVNELARIGELTVNEQIRLAFNYERMTTVSREAHDLSKPLTGAIFDVFVEVFQKELVESGAIAQDLADRSYHGPSEDVDDAAIQAEFTRAYRKAPRKFQAALLGARDYLGSALARTWSGLSPSFLSYRDVGRALMTADRELTGGAHQDTIRDCFSWREIALPQGGLELLPRTLADCWARDRA